MGANRLDPQQLFTPCDLTSLHFETTADLKSMEYGFGQARAETALQFGIDIKRAGYNIFVLGEPGSGRHATTKRLIEAQAKMEAAPPDLCYINNFEDSTSPLLLKLPAGSGSRLKRQMMQFVTELGSVLVGAFEAREYRARVETLQEQFARREEGELRKLGDEALSNGLLLLKTPTGFAFVPAAKGEPIPPEDFAKLPDEKQKEIATQTEIFQSKLQELLRELPPLRREMQNEIKAINRSTVALAVGHLIQELKDDHRELPDVLAFLDRVLADVTETAETLRDGTSQEGTDQDVSFPLARYQVNVIVAQANPHAPIIYEDNPTYQNLVGHWDHVTHMGTPATNFTLVRAGALHRANGGYLILDVEKLIAQPFAYEGLKRALKSERIRIEAPGQLAGILSMAALDPEPIPLNVKVVLIGGRNLFYILKAYDPDFDELFRVAADFNDDVQRDSGTTSAFANLVGHLAHSQSLRPFARDAVGRIIEQASRIASDAHRLTMQTGLISNLMVEAEHIAQRAGQPVVGRAQVEQALQAQVHRASRIHEILCREVLRETFLIATEGWQTGQINGLAVMELGGFAFAHAARITAATWQGKGDLIDIEREAQLGGRIHSKGVLILSSFLAARFARDFSLSLAASLVFEQSYGPVEGDSASLAEICALISALASVPIHQALAVTGSINQHGQVQAIGGVNDKIEGFFDLCSARGLSGEQGVVIPVSNVKHLMLRQDIVRACQENKFAVYAVSTVDEAVQLLTGRIPGEADSRGIFPPGSVNYLVATRLREMSPMIRGRAQAIE